MKIKVNHYKLYDEQFSNWWSEVDNSWVYDDFMADQKYKKAWISLTTLACHDAEDAVYVGMGSFSNELLWRFDRNTKKFESMGYEKVGDKYDCKFHRSLEIDDDGMIYAAPALFHDIDKQFEANGGRLLRFDTKTRKFEFLDLPFERAYVQSIALDRKRGIVYGFGALPEVFWRYDISTGKSKFIAYLGNGAELSQAHCPVIDDKGCVWGSYGIVRAFAYDQGPDSLRMFRYNPDHDKMDFFKFGLPPVRSDKGKIDTALNGNDGFLYFGTVGGSLVRFNPETLESKSYGCPGSKGRLTGLVRGKDELLYGISGDAHEVFLFTFDTIRECFVDIIPFFDRETGISPDKIHHMVMTADGVIYAGENDNNSRSSYLWECIIEK